MRLIVALRYWYYIVIVILTLLLAITSYCLNDATKTMQLMRVGHSLEIANNAALYEQGARQIEQENYQNVINAINESKKREQVLVADAASARDAVTSLSDTIDTLAANAKTDANFRIEYSNTTGQLLKSCSTEYIGLAKTTDRISNSLRAIEGANKRK